MIRNEHTACRPRALTLYVYGELEEGEALHLENHLQTCEGCRRALAELRSDLDILKSVPEDEPGFSPAAVERFNARVVERTRPRSRPPLGIPLGWTVTGAAALLLAMTLLAPQTGKQSPELAMGNGDEIERLPDPEMLLELELLENLDLLQELEEAGVRG